MIKTIQGLLDNESLLQTPLELQAVAYQVLYLLGSEEFSVRDFACHFVKTRLLSDSANLHIVSVIEQTLLRSLARVSDELILKT